MKSTIKLFQICLLLCGVFGADKDEVKTVPVMEGESVTLNSNLTEIQAKNVILWRFGDNGSTIAQIDGGVILYPYFTEIFRDRLQLNQQTGSLTIKNTRAKHSGLYKLQINSGTPRITFRVSVYVSQSVIDAGKAEMKSVSVMEGDSVTLQTDVTETQGNELIVWRFGDEGKLIDKCDIEAKSSPLYEDTDERFRDRLKLDHQTGSLTITNSRTTDSGLYTVKISSNKQTLYKRFSVIISAPGLSPGAVAGIVIGVLLVFAAAVAAAVIYYRRKISELKGQKWKRVSVSVMPGDPVTLNTDVTELHRDDLIEWRFGDKGSLIAEIREGRVFIYDTGLDKRFLNRLKLDKKTGSLTIMNTRETDTGLYELKISQDSKIKHKKFSVSVGEKTVSVFEGDPVTLKTDAEIHRDDIDIIEWRFGIEGPLIAEIRGVGIISINHNVPGGRFRDGLELDKTTGSLTITNTEMKRAGVYKLQITSNRGVSYKTFRVVVRERIISVNEGKNVILNPETEIQKDDQIQWKFGDQDILIAEIRGGTGKTHDDDERFRGRLRLDEKTGSLTITDITAEQSGVYKLQTISNRGTTNKRFVLTVFESLKPAEEGESLTLNPETEIQKDDQIQWRFGDQDILIAEIRGGTGKTHDDVDDGRFRGRLTLDEKTGTLIITDMRTEHTGVYKLQISSSRGTTNKRFFVIVPASLISAEEGEPLTLDPETEIQEDDLIQWMFGDQDILLAEIRGGTGKTHDDDVRFRGRLTLDEKTGSLTITRMRPEHTGVYKLQIRSSSRGTTNKTFKVVLKTDFSGNRVNDSATVEIPLLNEEDLDAGNEHEGMRLLMMR